MPAQPAKLVYCNTLSEDFLWRMFQLHIQWISRISFYIKTPRM